jgi:hypothetical protein
MLSKCVVENELNLRQTRRDISVHVDTPQRTNPGQPDSERVTLDLFKEVVWLQLTPKERLRRSWAMRDRIRDLRTVHDRKLFPRP